MRFLRFFVLALFTFIQILPTHARVQVRIKDIVSVEGVRGNQLVGYGLVVGLSGSGDTLGSTPFTKESLASMLERLGVNVRDNAGVASLNGKNVAAVMVTTTLPAFARQGSKIDVNVSALGDAKDLRGGTLLVTPLLAADGQVYAVAQGAVAVGGFKAEGQATSVTKGVPTAGRIASGAIVEKEVAFELGSMNKMKLNLNNPDFTTAKRVSDRINLAAGHISNATDPSTVNINIPDAYKGRPVEFITLIEQLEIEPDQSAKIVIDDHDGVIVMGKNVKISPVAISHGSITIKITERPEVSQPNPFAMATSTTINANTTPVTTTNTTTPPQATTPSASSHVNISIPPNPQNQPTNVPGNLGVIAPGPGTAVVSRTDIKVKEEKGKMTVLEESPTLQQLVDGLNALGATPRELITILQSIKASGALQAEIELM